MTFYFKTKIFEVYEVHPQKGVEIVMVPKGIGSLESLTGVNTMLDSAYQLICYDPSNKKAEVRPLSQGARAFFVECFEKQEVLRWTPAPVRRLAIS
jgi:hypothetical protein